MILIAMHIPISGDENEYRFIAFSLYIVVPVVLDEKQETLCLRSMDAR